MTPSSSKEWSLQQRQCGSDGSTSRKTTFTYDGIGRAKTTEVFMPTSTSKIKLVNSYDATARTKIERYLTGTLDDTLTFTYADYSGAETAVKRSTTTLTGYTWNADGTLASRSDDGIGSSSFTYTRLDQLTSASSPLYTGSATWSWQPDGLLATRSWPGTSNSATVAYDGMKRPTTLTETVSGTNQAVFTQAYDRANNVVTEGRTLSGISGVSGSGDQTFTYDKLHRVTSATLNSATQTYTYDADGNRTGVTRAGVTTTYAFDRADQAKTKTIGGGSPASFTYDTYGNLTSSQVDATGSTAYTYDAADSLASIDPPGASNTVAFTLDALSRNKTRSVNGSVVDTYGYVGESEQVDLLDRTTDIQAAISAAGDRTAIKQGSAFGWTLPDLHGSMAAMVASNGSAVSDAFRYDPYGELAGSSTSGPSLPWRFNGNLLLTESGTTDLYEMGARSYDPALGAFTQLDSMRGDAQHPFSLNGYVFAWSNPVNMVDPSGHSGMSLRFTDDVETGSSYISTLPEAKQRNVEATKKANQDAQTKKNNAAITQQQTTKDSMPDSYETNQGRHSSTTNAAVTKTNTTATLPTPPAPSIPQGPSSSSGAEDRDAFDRGNLPMPTLPTDQLGSPNAGSEPPEDPDESVPFCERPDVRCNTIFMPGELPPGILWTGETSAITLEGLLKGIRQGETVSPLERLGISNGLRITEREGWPVNQAGTPYPKVTDPRSGDLIPFPGVPGGKFEPWERAPWGNQERGAYIKEWHDQGLPDLDWSQYDIHHILPREYGGSNSWDNLVPVLRQVHQEEFNAFWGGY